MIKIFKIQKRLRRISKNSRDDGNKNVCILVGVRMCVCSYAREYE